MFLKKYPKITTILFAGFLLMSFAVSAQSTQQTIDSLVAALPPVKDDTNKVRLLSEISRAYYQVDPLEGIRYGQYALKLSEELHDTYGGLIAHSATARCYAIQSELPEALKHFNAALTIAQQLKLQEEVAQQLVNIANIYVQKRDHSQAFIYLSKAKSIYDKAGVKNQQLVESSIGRVYMGKGDNGIALSYFAKAIAMEEADKADPGVLAKLCTNIGGAYVLLQNYDSALHYLSRALDYNHITGNLFSTANSLNNISNLYTKMGNSDASVLPDSLRNKQHNFAVALAYEKQALDITYKIGASSVRREILNNMSYTYESMGDYKSALGVSELRYRLNDSLRLRSKERAFARIEAEGRVQKATDSLKYENLELRRRRGARNSLIAIISVSAIACISLINGQKQKQVQKRKLAEAERQRAEELAQQQLKDFTGHIQEKNELIAAITAEIEKLKQSNTTPHLIDENILSELQAAVLVTDEQWEGFKASFDKVHAGYLARLKYKLPDITPAETRFVVLSKLNLSPKEMAAMLGISAPAVRASKYRLMKKLGIEDDTMLDSLIQSI